MAVWDETGTTPEGRVLGEAAQAEEVRRAVRQARGYWYRAGVPRSERRRKAEELETHLEAALADGRRVRDVIGDDPPAFASRWAQADRRRPWLEPLLSLIAAATFVPGVTALLAPVVLDQDRTGIPMLLAALLAVVIPVALALQMLRRFRASLRPQQAALVGVLIAVLYVAGWTILAPQASDADRLLEVAPSIAWSMVVVGAAVQVLLSWSKRTSRL